ncbi:TIGR02996 domain-containing protein [Tuwongella immobilis]|uniref:Repeat-companion domain protein n=1 Tax=Tuwongella immobilis TaxID=692036 RepID=A0A6C2YNJ3_9BACT|nr:TIGR02996 domain-containing protein [Tuwongella immobilis]VIP03188.1 Repeat-companion domain protein OS=Isosphaera pallida (strain ATCC 43644 / DSM 9630 / IS1B) GN=Isop_0537 PE=4 SV=1 [Tuwongella immobilis]VTS03651.1 Repeat-companion domain protein OS=Isosphaera pallida (strain ATCC 43644 / DSM 9630 / IS1B) GN=Isop_0537 PE=4 SV=1 [Tuwongella immobilis]
MDEREALIQAIFDNPDDDAARLAYAAWQEAHGDPAHAELIRAQCKLATLQAGDPERKKLKRRVTMLLKRPENVALTEYDNEFEGGMVRSASWYGGEDAFDYAGVPLERVLALEACDFSESNWPDVAAAARIAAAPWLRRCRRVAFHEFVVDAAVLSTLAKSPHLTNLREVVFSDCTVSADSLAELVLNPSVRGVETIMLQGDSGSWNGLAGPLKRILSDPRSQSLRRLYLLAKGLPAEIADVLIQSSGLTATQIWIYDRLSWLTPEIRSALETRFGTAIQFDSTYFLDPYSYCYC